MTHFSLDAELEGRRKPPPAAPFLRWAGSKRHQFPLVSSLLPPAYRRYVEPFAGSAALFFLISPERALLADLNRDLVETFQQVRENPEAVATDLHSFPLGRDAYYEVRAESDAESTSAHRAARFIYLNRFCFNGLFRTNSSGEFNVPYGRPRNDNRPTLEQLKACSRLLHRAEVRCQDFRDTLAQAKEGDFFYIDPPYAVSTRRVFNAYLETPFSDSDLEALSQGLNELHNKGVYFLVSYADSREARSSFSRWSSFRRRVRRNVAGFKGARRYQYELLFSNFTLRKGT